MTRTFRPAACAVLAAGSAALTQVPAYAQRAASSPSVEESGAAEAAPTPPPGFPAPMLGGLVYGGQIETHLQSDIISATGSKTRVSVFDDTNLTGYVNYQNWASLNAEAKLERNRNDNLNSFYPDRNAFFRSEGVTLRQLYATIRPYEGLSFYGGKIHPAFGSAYDRAPGQYYNFATDYEQDERIGFGAEYAVRTGGPAALGLDQVRLSAETFFLDTSFLSSSLFSAPSFSDPAADRARRFSRNQFGPSNTGSFDSFTFALRGGREGRGLAWQASFTREATAEPGGRTETGQSIGASYDPGGDGIPLGPRLGVRPFLEYAHFSNFAGVAGLDRHYAVGGLAFTYVRWQVSVAAGLRRSTGVTDATDHQVNLSVAYEILPRLQIGAGINFINLDGRASRAFSPVLNYERAF